MTPGTHRAVGIAGFLLFVGAAVANGVVERPISRVCAVSGGSSQFRGAGRGPVIPAATTDASSLPVVTPKPRSPAVDNASAEAFLKQWASSQTQGDFAGYSAAYDAGFTGVKRTHKGQEKHYTRASWLNDRRKMFHARVEVRRPEVRLDTREAGAASPLSAEVYFDQYWASRTYADKGRKRLALTRAPGGPWRITREEMLTSERWDRRTYDDE